MFSRHTIDRKYKKIKYHLLYAFRLMCEKEPLKALSSNKSQDYCDFICNKLCDRQQCEDAFNAAVALVNQVLGREPNDTDGNRADFTVDLNKTMSVINRINKERNKK